MYKSPIEVFMTDIQHQIEQQRDEEIYKAVVSVGINVDKKELIRALRYDRQQYNAGFLAGMAAAKPEWIPVTERLPENDTYILVTTDRVVVPAYWHNDRFYAFTANGVATVGGVTHWMPLPEPPKEVSYE